MKYYLLVFSIVIHMSSCGQVREVETENLVFDPDFEENYFSPLIVDQLITKLRNNNASGIYSDFHPNLKNQLTQNDFKEYLDLIALFYGKLEKISPFFNSKRGNVSQINLTAKYSKTDAKLTMVFVEDEHQEIKIGSILIKPTSPYDLDSLNQLCLPIIKLLKEKNVYQLYPHTTEKFREKFDFPFFEKTLNEHFKQYEFLDHFEMIDQLISVPEPGNVIVLAEYKFEYKKGFFRKVVMVFQRENNQMNLTNIDFSIEDYSN